MARKELSLVPEWLKGAAATAATGGVSQFPQSPFHQGYSISSERDSSAHAFPERVLYPPSWRSDTSDGLIEHSAEQSLRPRSFVSGRSRVYQNNGIDLDAHSNHDWNLHNSLMHGERSKDTALDISGSNEKQKDRYPSEFFAFDRQTSEKYITYAPDITISPVQSMVRCQKSLGNGGERTAIESAASPIRGVGLAGSIQHATFEKKFPSLNSQDRLYALQSNLGDISLLNSRLLEEPSSRTNSKHVFSSDISIACFDGVPNSEAAVGSTGTTEPFKISDARDKTVLSADMTAAPVAPSIASTQASVSSSTHVLKPAKLAVETQPLEAVALRQLRPLVPMKPAFSRIMGLSPRDKLQLNAAKKVKPVVPVTSWVTRTSSQPFNASHHQELPTNGKLVLRKNSREAAATNASFTKLEGGTCVPLVASSGTNLAMGKIGVSNTSTTNVNFLKQPKKSLVRIGAPIPVSQTAADVGTVKQYMARKSTSHDKRILVQTQNRSEFFNALRRKAAVGEAALSKFDNKTSVLRNRNEVFARDENQDESVMKNDALLGDVHSGLDGIAVQKSFSSMSISGNVNGTQKGNPANVLILEGMKAVVSQSTAEDLSTGMLPASHVAGSEEEEAAFLRLLGWQESAEEGEEALTEEEINAFYQEHKFTLTHLAKTKVEKC
ncbi:hypothetical protein O6H91_11G032000 [Diphasiastrum complanatum]|uniref:Uncharacterized protein n=1 Tax=Diphasiastrum complanatum TaxID=34168 RepID=A0ACC2C7I7_DIPCM|nr:hypothetical protein O6H91_11G032000 [Diphasiastrum complanatum]